MNTVLLDFGNFSCTAMMYDVPVVGSLLNSLPCHIRLSSWGDELYGSIGKDLGTGETVPVIPDGGIAYSMQGNYVCFFYGQKPAWPVVHIGNIVLEDITKLKKYLTPESVTIRLK